MGIYMYFYTVNGDLIKENILESFLGPKAKPSGGGVFGGGQKSSGPIFGGGGQKSSGPIFGGGQNSNNSSGGGFIGGQNSNNSRSSNEVTSKPDNSLEVTDNSLEVQEIQNDQNQYSSTTKEISY